MKTIQQWVSRTLPDTTQSTPVLYKSYSTWVRDKQLGNPESFSLFKTMLKSTTSEIIEDVSEPVVIEPKLEPEPEPVIVEEIVPEVIQEVVEEEPIPEVESESIIIGEEEIFKQVVNYTRSICDPCSTDYAFICSGDSGLGKTVEITTTLKELLGPESDTRQFISVKELENYEVEISTEEEEVEELQWIEGPTKIQTMNLYIFLYRENGKVILFDDADSLIDNPKNFDILKKVLDSKKIRKVGYGAKPIILKKADSEGEDVIIPNSFECTSRIIVVTNKPFYKMDKALLTRSLVAEINLSAEECLKRVQRLLPYLCQDDPRVSQEIRQEVLDYLMTISNLFKKLDLRSVEQSIKERLRNPDSWKELVKRSLLIKDKDSKN